MEKAFWRFGREIPIQLARGHDRTIRFVVSALILCAAFTPSRSLGNSPREHSYYGTFSGDVVLLREPGNETGPGEIIYAGHVFYPARFCDSKSTFICFFSDRFTFAVPKRMDPLARSWTLNGAQFELVKDHVSVEIVGRRFENLMVIKTPAEADGGGRASGKPSFFLYSYATGLVAFGRAQSPTQSITFWMQGPLGFGALLENTIDVIREGR